MAKTKRRPKPSHARDNPEFVTATRSFHARTDVRHTPMNVETSSYHIPEGATGVVVDTKPYRDMPDLWIVDFEIETGTPLVRVEAPTDAVEPLAK